jgi:hypothetical protein
MFHGISGVVNFIPIAYCQQHLVIFQLWQNNKLTFKHVSEGQYESKVLQKTPTHRKLLYWIWYAAVSASELQLDFSLSPTETIN